jgi:hypothetical protein
MDATVISRYAGMGGATASVAAEPQRDLLHHAKSAAPQVMTDALAHIPIRSNTRLSADNFHFISAVESDPASRMEPACGSDWLASLASLPTLRELAGISGGCQSVTLSRRISPGQVQQFANRWATCRLSIVDPVSGFYASIRTS